MWRPKHESSVFEGAPVAEFLGHLTAAVHAHRAWLDRLNHALVCGAAVSPAEMADNAHELCIFGRWYLQAQLPRGLPSEAQVQFAKIGSDHQVMHGLAKQLLQAQSRKDPSSSSVYLQFTASVHALGLDIEGLSAFLQERYYAMDALTGLLNRHAMYSDLERLVPQLAQTGQCVVVALADIDFFKVVNDNHGHSVGDVVLQEVAKTLLRQTRRGDQVYRYGGEEMLLLLHDCDQPSVHSLLEHVRRCVADARVVGPGGTVLSFTISIGAAYLRHDTPLHSVLEAADRALYVAKASGRNCVRWSEPG